MARPKKVTNIIEEINELDISPELKAEIIHDLDDIPDVEEKSRTFVGYNPVTGVEVWE